MTKALPLSEYIYEVTLPAKHRVEIIFNLAEIYQLPFQMETVENLFDFPETVVGDNWEDYYSTDDGALYQIGKGDEYMISPQTIGDFIHDCNRIWKKDLVWDGNLIKRHFKYQE